jgi:Xaa-Pro aminopeptidase
MTNAQIRYAQLCDWLKANNYEGMLLPVTDEYQGEYSADYARRVTWLTGFDGSAGMVVFLPKRAGLLVDGRYTLQATKEVDSSLYSVRNSGQMSLAQYLKQHVAHSAVVAYDPWLHSVAQITALEAALDGYATLVALERNPIDLLWQDQPSRPAALIVKHDDALAGRSAAEKLSTLWQQMTTDALLITEPDAICWLLNIRGSDVPYNPLPLCYALCHKDGDTLLYINPDKVPNGGLPDGVQVVDDALLAQSFAELACTTLGYDPKTAPIWFVQQCERVGQATRAITQPITLMKAIKNDSEIANMRRAHAVDGVAVTNFIQWFEGLRDDEVITELDVVAQLEHFRAQHQDYKQPSFATIAGAGEHGAIVHYRADAKSNRRINVGDALLLDSGGQYEYGTTDITRTLFRGCAPAHFKRHFTLVLKGHIALATAQFPEGTTGSQLDVLARQFLWAEGLDYAHGTGHGVGHYLCVHEGPQSISMRPNAVALRAGMILSNEPGYYAEGQYGIRIESLILVVEKPNQGGQRFLGFETLSRAPINEHLVDKNLLTHAERQWLQYYNALCAASYSL